MEFSGGFAGRRNSWISAAFAALLASVAVLVAQESDVPPRFKTTTEAVRVDVLATDRTGRPVQGLSKDDFKIFEDGVEQEIVSFFAVDAPFAVGLVLDTSSSTEGKLGAIKNAAARFVQELHPDDEVMVISFDDEVYLDTEFTRNRDTIDRAIRSTRTGQSTQLYEAVYLALEQMQSAVQRKVLVLFTDGVDTASPTTNLSDTIRLAKEADVLIYTIYFDTEYEMLSGGPRGGNPRTGPIGSPLPIPTPLPGPGSRRGPVIIGGDPAEIRRQYSLARDYLNRLAKAGGGRRLNAKGDVSDLAYVFAAIAQELRTLYSLTYVSNLPYEDDDFRKIKVKPQNKRLRVRHREGYHLPERAGG